VPSPFLGTQSLTFAVFQHFIVQMSHMMVGRCNKYLKTSEHFTKDQFKVAPIHSLKTVVGHLKS